jgi:hypothetical protein
LAVLKPAGTGPKEGCQVELPLIANLIHNHPIIIVMSSRAPKNNRPAYAPSAYLSFCGAKTLTMILTETLLSCSLAPFPNVQTMLRLTLVTSVNTATGKRSNSSLHFVKDVYRSTMGEDRLNALLLPLIHRDAEQDNDEIVNIFARRNMRKMLLINHKG